MLLPRLANLGRRGAVVELQLLGPQTSEPQPTCARSLAVKRLLAVEALACLELLLLFCFVFWSSSFSLFFHVEVGSGTGAAGWRLLRWVVDLRVV